MDFLDEILNIFGFNDVQKKETFNNLNSFIKPKVTQELIGLLPEDKIRAINEVQDYDSIQSQKMIASLISENLDLEKIEEIKKIVIGQIVLAYISHMFNESSIEEQNKIKEILLKNGIKG